MGLALLLVAGPAVAQQGIGPAAYSVGSRFDVGPALPSGYYFPGSGYSTINRGYTAHYIPDYYASPYTRYPSYYSNPPPYRTGTDPSYYYVPNYPGIFMTSINYPGIYGAHSLGLEPGFVSFRTAPEFTGVRYAPGVNTVITNTTATPAAVTTTLSTATGEPALIDVVVPASAQIWFDGVQTRQTGTTRAFVTPGLARGRDYRYTVRATWPEGDREVVREKTVRVRAGDRTTVSFESEPTQTELRGSTNLYPPPAPRP
jgi:uncharacterized protein (TIGR03000 family)